MFNNLIESSSHRSEYRRRASFFLFTTASYAVFFVIAGVASIYAYDARMGDQNLEFATIMPLVDLPVPEPPPAESSTPASAAKQNANPQNYYLRKTPMATVDNPQLAPIDISTKPNANLPMPPSGIVKLSSVDANPSQPGGSGSNGDGRNSSGESPAPVVAIVEPPPAQPVRKPAVSSKGVITSEALSLPKPPYPEMAKQMRLQGKVTVQVLIDETGRVISARVLDGHPVFKQPSERAALQARFSPTRLGDQPVKVSGVISYNFVLQ